MKTNKNWLVLILALVVLLGIGQTAQAALVGLGPPNPNTTSGTDLGIYGVPLWYEDTNNLRLELCLPNAAEIAAGACLALIPAPLQAIAFPTNYPDEAFWFAADAFLPAPADGLLVLALESAFSTGPVIEANQVVFGRLRYRIVVPGPGTYTVTTPYGIFTEVVPLGVTVINVSRDIGIGSPGVFTGALNSDIGPFLRASATPGGAVIPFFDGAALRPGAFYLLNPAIPTTAVTGGTTGNIFSVVGPAFNFQTDQFTLQGRVFNGNVPTSLSGVLATYTRPAVGTGFVEVLANSATTANLTTAAAGQIPATTMLTDPGTGRFKSRVPITPSTILPASLTVTADNTVSNPFNTPTTLGANLTDLVIVTSAEHDPSTRTLTIQAASSDEASPPLLTATGFGNLVSGIITVNNVNAPPTTVTVTSSKGGSGAKGVTNVGPATGTRASYCRPDVGNGFVEVFAKSTPTALLTVSDPTGQIPTTPMVTSPLPLAPSDPSYGKFFVQIPITNATILPATLVLTVDNKATDPNILPVSIGVALVDLVTIATAEYDPVTEVFTIQAASCDALPPPALTAVGIGNLTSGKLTVNNVKAAPATVTVSSSRGGSDSKEVFVIPAATGTLANYCRPTFGNGVVEVFAKSTPTALLTVSDPTGKIPTTPMVTSPIPLVPSDPSYGKFFVQIPITQSTILPTTLILTVDNKATNPNIAPVGIGVDLVDLVTTTLAEYNPVNRILTIQAASCDALAPPVLTAVGFGNLNLGYLNVKNLNAPPSEVIVNSSKGGSDTREVTVTPLRLFLPLINK